MIEERRQGILRELAEKGTVRVSELSKKYQCSEVTIRNDIKNMDEEGLLVRTHGGALPIAGREEHKYKAESIYRFTNRKKNIAACAYSYIEDHDTIIIDDASSSFYLAEYIKEHPQKRIAVVTNSLLVGNELSEASHVELFMVCGYVGGHLAATMGTDAVECIKKFHVDKAFIGVHGINFEVGYTSIATPQMEVKKAILGAAGETYVLADSSKFGGGYLSVVCPIDAVHMLITDSEVSGEVVKKARASGITMVISE